MGMYDKVFCEIPLAIPPGKIEYQTKAFECYLHDYTITKDGRLLCDNTDINFHGEFDFYTLIDGKIYVEYRAKFTDGQLVNIEERR